MDERQLTAAPLAFGFMFKLGIFLGQLNDCVIALVYIELKPNSFDSLFGDANAGGQSTAVVPAGAIAGNQRRDESVGQASVGRFVRLGHFSDNFTSGKCVS